MNADMGVAQLIAQQDRMVEEIGGQWWEVSPDLRPFATPLHDAAGRGDLSHVAEILLDQPKAVDTTGGSGDLQRVTALHVATTRNRLKVMRALIRASASVNAVAIGPLGGSPLHMAARAGRVAAVRMLIAAGAKIEACHAPRSATPLHMAARGGHVQAMFYLVMGSASLKQRDGCGEAVFFTAARAGHVLAAAHVLASIEHTSCLCGCDDEGMDIAVSPSKSCDSLTCTVGVGGSGRGLREWREPTRDQLDRAARIVSDLAALPDAVYHHDGRTPLIWAASAGRADAVHMLVDDCGLNVNEANNCEKWTTPMHVAACNGSVPTIRALLVHGAEVDSGDVLGFTPLCRAAMHGQVNAIFTLLTAGARLVWKPNDMPGRMLHTADMMQGMISADGRPREPFALATLHGHTEAAAVLRHAECFWSNHLHPNLHARARHWVHHLLLTAQRLVHAEGAPLWLPVELWLMVLGNVKVRDMLAGS
jgi:ankyrin repeat protein